MANFFQSLFGSPSRMEQIQTLQPWQQQQLRGLSQTALPQAMGYFQNLLNPSAQAYQDFAGPALQQYQQEIVPGIAGRFAGGNALRSSAFNDAIGRSARDLGTQLNAQRAGMQFGAAQNLQGLGQLGLTTPGFIPSFRPQSQGILSAFAPLAAQAAMSYFGAPNFSQLLGATQGGGMGGFGSTSGGFNYGPHQYTGVATQGVPPI